MYAKKTQHRHVMVAFLDCESGLFEWRDDRAYWSIIPFMFRRKKTTVPFNSCILLMPLNHIDYVAYRLSQPLFLIHSFERLTQRHWRSEKKNERFFILSWFASIELLFIECTSGFSQSSFNMGMIISDTDTKIAGNLEKLNRIFIEWNTVSNSE